MTFKNKNIIIVVSYLVLAIIFVYIFSSLNTKTVQYNLGKALALLLAFALLWFSPHFFTKKIFLEQNMPAVFFAVGSLLIVTGCYFSIYFSSLMKLHGTWEDIGEIVPLVLGAVIGGNYCCDAILGQDFNGKFSRLTLLSGSPSYILIMVVLFASIEHQSGTVYSSIFIVGLCPIIPVIVLNALDKNPNLNDPALWILTAGFILITITILCTKFLLDSFPSLILPSGVREHGNAFIFVKNLVPSYSASIGVGLILRAVEKNINVFSLEEWAAKYFASWNIVSITPFEMIFSNKSNVSHFIQTVTIKSSTTVIKALNSNAYKRNLYGSEVSAWFNLELAKEKNQGVSQLVLHMPSSRSLMKNAEHQK